MDELFQRPFREVLVVDDEPATAKLIKLYLEKSGFQVRMCSDASQACWEIASRPPHFIISDWSMPNMDGGALCEWVREHSEDYIYFILMTAHEKFFDSIDGFDAGADDFLRKPIDSGELRSRLKCGERILQLQERLKRMAVSD